MKVTKKINFKELRDKGANALDIKDDEVIQLDAKKGMLCIVTQEYLLKLIEIEIENESKFNWITSKQDLGAQITGSVNYLNNKGNVDDLGMDMKGFMGSVNPDKKFEANGLNKPKVLGENISSLLKGSAPKKLEDRVDELENIVKDLLLNKEENNGKGKI